MIEVIASAHVLVIPIVYGYRLQGHGIHGQLEWHHERHQRVCRKCCSEWPVCCCIIFRGFVEYRTAVPARIPNEEQFCSEIKVGEVPDSPIQTVW